MDTGRRIEALAAFSKANHSSRIIYTDAGEAIATMYIRFDALAWVNLELGRNAEAEKYAKAIALATPEPSFYFHPGVIALALGKRDEARKHLSKALELNPKFDRAHAREAAALPRSLI